MASTTTQSSENKRYSSIVIAAIFFALYGIITFIFHPKTVTGDSMLPTYSGGDIVWCEPISDASKLQNGDIAVIELWNINCIKRLVASPGDDVMIMDGQIYVNGEKSFEADSIQEPGVIPVHEKGELPMHLDDDEYLFIGDNRNFSDDCRLNGPVSAKDIKYKVLRKIY